MNTSRHDIPMTSAPIEIPSRDRFMSPSQVSYQSIPQTTPYSPELLFEMSPVEVETEVQSSSFRSSTIPVSRWNRDQLFSFPKKLPGSLVNHASSPQPEPQQQSKQTTYSPKYSNSRTSFNDKHTNCGDAKAKLPMPVLTPAPPVIRTVAIHKIAGFQPEKSQDLQPGTCRSPAVENASLPPLAPSDSFLTTALPWLLPGTKDADDDDDFYLSQSPGFFDFKNFLLRRRKKSRSNAP